MVSPLCRRRLRVRVALTTMMPLPNTRVQALRTRGSLVCLVMALSSELWRQASDTPTRPCETPTEARTAMECMITTTTTWFFLWTTRLQITSALGRWLHLSQQVRVGTVWPRTLAGLLRSFLPTTTSGTLPPLLRPHSGCCALRRLMALPKTVPRPPTLS
eukprot:Rmarinus@m.4265